MTREHLNRLQPHNGDLGTGGWVSCFAPCCGELHHGQGWFAIKAGEPHYFDPVTYRHMHADCFLEMRERVDRQHVVNEAIVTRGITGWFRKTGTE